ncbi:MAG TPA: VWA domain-containing protein [Candidatus Binataceae bacterium]|nr:VWA domain-containing protein [Candidatus Binataceae bacterium]
MTPLRDQIVNFVAALRAAGIRISVSESIDAARAVGAAGLERASMCEALAAALVKDEGDRAVFDQTFAQFFSAPASGNARGQHPDHRGRLESAASGRGRPGEEPSGVAKPRERRQESRAAAKSAQQEREERPADRQARRTPAKAGERGAPAAQSDEHSGEMRQAENRGPEEHGIEAGRVARSRAIERTPFAAYTDLEFVQARDTLAILKRRFRVRLGRRLRIAKAGRIDFRRTIRAATQRGGALADLRFRARRPRRIDLTILADVSGSVRYAAELMLELVAGARENFHRVRSFVYIDRLAEADFEGGHLVTAPALDLYARSDFGRVLGELWDRRAQVLGRQTIVVILGDGRNNRRPARADLLREIARNCRAVVWLNPEDPARWGTGDSAIEKYAREVRAHVAVRDLRELERGLLAIA